jgi:hypothetical protein
MASAARRTRSATPALRCGPNNMDPYTLAYYAGHSDFATTRRYVHPNVETGREAMQRARVARGGHNSGHSGEAQSSDRTPEKSRNVSN